MGRLNNSNIAKLVEKRREAGDNSQKGTGGNRGGTGGGRRLPPCPPPPPHVGGNTHVANGYKIYCLLYKTRQRN